nr:hypothetical protein [Streptomyces sp. 846.5]
MDGSILPTRRHASAGFEAVSPSTANASPSRRPSTWGGVLSEPAERTGVASRPGS